MRLARWTLIGMVAGVVAGLMAGLLRRQPTRSGREAYAGGYAPPVPSVDRSVAPVRPKTSPSWSGHGSRSDAAHAADASEAGASEAGASEAGAAETSSSETAVDTGLGADATRDPIAVDGRAER